MIKTLPQTKRDIIQAYLEEERSHIRIIEEMNVIIQIVKNFSTNLKYHGIVKLSIISRRDRSSIFIQTMINVLIFNSQFEFTFFVYINHDSRY